MLYLAETTINQTEVEIIVNEELEISFTINYEFDKSEEVSSNRLAITKWLLKEFSFIKQRFSYLWCKPYANDGLGDYREKAFIKAGFYANKGLLCYGDIKSKPLSIPYSKSKTKLIVREEVPEYFLPAIDLPYSYRQEELTVTKTIEGYFYKAVNNPNYKRKKRR